jgi:hypothetical protein
MTASMTALMTTAMTAINVDSNTDNDDSEGAMTLATATMAATIDDGHRGHNRAAMGTHLHNALCEGVAARVESVQRVAVCRVHGLGRRDSVHRGCPCSVRPYGGEHSLE